MGDDGFMTINEAAVELKMDEADVWMFLDGMGISTTLADLNKGQMVGRNRIHRALKTMRGELLADALRRRAGKAKV